MRSGNHDGALDHPDDPQEDDRTRNALVGAFTEMIATAPAPPSVDELARAAPRCAQARRRRHATLAAMAAAAALVIAFLFYPFGDRATSARVALAQAAQKYLNLDDAEFRVVFDFTGMQSLARLLGSDTRAEPKHYKLLVRSPHDFVFQELDASRGTWNDTLDIVGFDGGIAWDYDPKTRCIEVRPPKSLHAEGRADGELQDMDWLSYLSFDFARELQQRDGEHDADRVHVEDITGASDERVGRRILRLQPKATDQSRFAASWSESVLTIDVRTGLIQKATIEAQLVGLSLLRFEIDLVGTNRGIATDSFRWQTYLDENTVSIDREH